MTLDTLARNAAAELHRATGAVDVPAWSPARRAHRAARVLQVAAAILAVLGIAAVALRDGSSTDVVAGRPLTRAELVARSEALVREHVAGDFHSSRKYFSTRLADALPEVTLEGNWAQVVAQLGPFVAMERAEVRTEGGLTVVAIPLVFERGRATRTIYYAADGTMEGIRIAPPGSVPEPSPPAQLVEAHTATLQAIVAGDFEAARAHFGPSVRELSAEQLADVWRQVVTAVGPFRSEATAQAVRTEEGLVLNSIVTFERGTMQFRTTWDASGQIVGIWILKPGVPLP